VAEDGVADTQQPVHAGDDGELVGFASLYEPLVQRSHGLECPPQAIALGGAHLDQLSPEELAPASNATLLVISREPRV
jgi:hypothetical protein